MSSDPPKPQDPLRPSPAASELGSELPFHPRGNPRSDPIRTHAEMLAVEADAKAARRLVDLEELRSDLKSPEERIRAWERVHGLTLPLNPNHPILDAIAVKTRLTLEQVQAVQREEAARRAARSAR
jgi:hypothetical protein